MSGISVLAGSPADFGKLIAEETEKWGKVVRHQGGLIRAAKLGESRLDLGVGEGRIYLAHRPTLD